MYEDIIQYWRWFLSQSEFIGERKRMWGNNGCPGKHVKKLTSVESNINIFWQWFNEQNLELDSSSRYVASNTYIGKIA